MEIIIYPDNTACIDGRFRSIDLKAYKIPERRQARTHKEAEQAMRFCTKGDVVLAFRQPIINERPCKKCS